MSKKDLTILAFALILAQEPPSLFHLAFALAPPRQKSQKIKRFFEIIGVVFHVEHLRAQKLFQR